MESETHNKKQEHLVTFQFTRRFIRQKEVSLKSKRKVKHIKKHKELLVTFHSLYYHIYMICFIRQGKVL